MGWRDVHVEEQKEQTKPTQQLSAVPHTCSLTSTTIFAFPAGEGRRGEKGGGGGGGGSRSQITSTHCTGENNYHQWCQKLVMFSSLLLLLLLFLDPPGDPGKKSLYRFHYCTRIMAISISTIVL